jgi:hypothetical protein
VEKLERDYIDTTVKLKDLSLTLDDYSLLLELKSNVNIY